MASSYTTNKKLELPANGDYVSTWNLPVNADLTTIDTALGGYQVLNPTGQSGTVALTSSTSGSPPYTVTAQWQAPNIVIGTSLTGTATLTANVVYQLPTGIGGVWSIYNNTTGAFTVSFSSAGGGTSVLLPQGYATMVVCDGTNVRLANNGSTVFGASALRLLGSTSGYSGLQSPAVGGNVTWSLPGADGSSGQVLVTNGAGALSFSSITSGVSSFQTSLSGLTPSTATGGAITLAGTLGVVSGGTGVTSSTGTGSVVLNTSPSITSASLITPAVGSGGLTIAGSTSGTLTVKAAANAGGWTFAFPANAGTNGYILSTDGAGNTSWITNTGGGGTVTSINVSGGSTGFTFSGGPVTGSGTITMSGSLGVAGGGTGATSLTGYVKGSGTSALTAVAAIPGSDVSGNIPGNAANITGTYAGTISSSQVTTALGYTPPQPGGTGASGTWGINITGSAGSASTATTATTATNQSGGTVSATTGTFSTSLLLTGTGLSSGSALGIGGFNGTYGGAWYMTNQYGSATNPTKWFRVNSVGGLEVINNAYNTVIMTLTDAGALTIPSTMSATTFSGSGSGLTGSAASLSIGGSSGSCTGNSATATTATTANALATGNNYQMNSLGVGTGASGTTGEIRATNNVTAYYSDDRLKDRIGNIPDALAKLRTLNGFHFTPNETAQLLGYDRYRQVGVSAQEVEAILPEIVVPAPISDRFKTVQYEKLAPLFVEAMKEMADKIDALQAEVAALKGRKRAS
jgi:hypothetical protein